MQLEVENLKEKIKELVNQKDFQLYSFVKKYH